MALGIILIIAGILIAVFPQLLSLIVALILIFEGTFIILLSRAYKRTSQSFNDPLLDFFFKW